MKRIFLAIIPLILVAAILLGCGGSDLDESVVKLDGPILETIGNEGNLEFNGAVVNTAEYPVKSVYVVILLRDSAGEILETNNILISTGEEDDEVLDPLESRLFSIPFKSNAGEVYSRDVEIYYELTDQ